MLQKSSIIDVWLGSKYVSANLIGNNVAAELIFFIKKLCTSILSVKLRQQIKNQRTRWEEKKNRKEKFYNNILDFL